VPLNNNRAEFGLHFISLFGFVPFSCGFVPFLMAFVQILYSYVPLFNGFVRKLRAFVQLYILWKLNNP
jgi:hypothetical protein